MPAIQRAAQPVDWAEDEDYEDSSALPGQQIISNADGTKTVITYRLEDGKKIKTTRKIRTTVVKEHVNPRVAERREWAKFGKEQGNVRGPDISTTTIGENMLFKPSMNWKANQKEEVQSGTDMKTQLKDKKVACRICKSDHFTARCPYKDTLPPMDDIAGTTTASDDVAAPDMNEVGGSRYIAPHLRKGAAGAGDKLGGASRDFGGRERDDLATLRVTNVSELAEEADLRDMFERFGRVTRVFLAKDRETGRSKGFAFVSYAERSDAAKACERMDGHGFGHLILRVEFAKRAA
ncbi:eukaryotic translation initiation factor 3 [Terfezia boudieri ATCC MYA-4762]|uniref:Eukaryotic translation initiation factor 3 subunit G n=1 Tax=Terfezia boudieri ATCC MYA-4762 TaxID=1051890 RepID=A0A3N4LT23_9PEZI|nr:eukaryotic translation initiation factor 3 [Terfezia boudieri ATCC MYA-4762]